MKIGIPTLIFLTSFFFYTSQNSVGQTVYIVDSVDDFEDVDLADSFCADKNGTCTLRAALQNVNKANAKCKVGFDLPGKGPFIIKLSRNLPKITSPVDLDATTQAGYKVGSPQIILDGGDVFVKLAKYDVEKSAVVLHLIKGSSGSTIKGFVINGVRGVGILIDSDLNIIQQNFVGTRQDGCNAFRNTTGIFVKGMDNLIGGEESADKNLISGNGVGIFTNAKNNIIGNYIGTTWDGNDALGNEIGIAMVRYSKLNVISQNLISGNKSGIDIVGNNNKIFKNKIGTNALGNMKIPNETGIRLVSARFNSIGGRGEGNLISGNRLGIYLFKNPVFDIPESFNEIKGNIIGLDISGTKALGNETGVQVEGGRGDLIGGVHPGEQNVISGNSDVGMEIKNVDGFLIQGNYIGTDASGNKAVPNGVGVRFSEDPKYLGLGESIFSDNVVSGNRSHGIEINGLAQHAIVGNFIGIAKDGVTSLPNYGSGIKILRIHNLNCIGGMADSQTNQIAFNNLYGIEIFSNEFHSVDAENLSKTNRVFNNLHSDFLIDGAKKEKGNN